MAEMKLHDRRVLNSKWVAAGVLTLLLLFVAQAAGSMRVKSVTTDELMYIAAGYYHLRTGSFELNMTNPPLMKMIPAAPLLALDLDLPRTEEDPAEWGIVRQWQYAREFLYHNTEDADRILLIARTPVIALGVLLGLYVFVWSRQLYGDVAGLFSLSLYSFSPNILAHTRLATLDLGLATFMFIFAYHWWRFLRRPSALQLGLCSLSLSAAILTKTTAFFLIPMAGLYALLLVVARPTDIGRFPSIPFVPSGPWKGRLQQLAAVALVFAVMGVACLFLVNLCYGFQGTFVDSKLPLPGPFMQIIWFQSGHTADGNNIYFAGETSKSGWWFLMAFSFLVKTPLPLLLLVGFALYGLVRYRDALDGELLLLIIAGVTLGLFTYLKTVAVGLRYVLPMYPALHVLTARVLRNRFRMTALGWGALAVLLGWYIVGSVRVYPDYLANFNELIGGPRNAYKYIADSHLDWGQDLEQLDLYLEDRGIERIRLAYFGSADPEYYGISYDYLPSVGVRPTESGQFWWYEVEEVEDLPPLELEGGPIAISATLLAGVFYPGYYADLREFEPVDWIGNSILIFEPPGNDDRLEAAESPSP